MQDHLIFFGKSQGFTLYAFTQEGLVQNFDLVIPDFDLLESKWFNIDKPNNTPIVAKYKFKSGGLAYSLLKLYSYAQAAAGNRIEGSIYGMAILSSGDIGLSESNINLLSSLKGYFSDMALEHLKFKKDDFKVESEAIWKAFADQVGFNTIEKSDNLDLYDSDLPTALHVANIKKLPGESQWEMSASNKMYFSEDLNYLERALKKWQTSLAVYTPEKNGIYTRKAEQVNPPDAFTSNNSAIQVSELRNVQQKLQANVAALKDRIRRLKFICLLLALAFVTVLPFLFLVDSKPAGQQIQPSVSNQVNPQVHAPLERYILDTLLTDSTRFNKVHLLFTKINKYRTTRDLKSKNQQLKSMLLLGNILLLDSTQLKQKLK